MGNCCETEKPELKVKSSISSLNDDLSKPVDRNKYADVSTAAYNNMNEKERVDFELVRDEFTQIKQDRFLSRRPSLLPEKNVTITSIKDLKMKAVIGRGTFGKVILASTKDEKHLYSVKIMKKH